jgi:hypothetical protein
VKLELADIFRKHLSKLGPLSGFKARVANAILRCRTEALGGHLWQCDHCGHRVISHNSCRDRHCPKCQALEAARWMEFQKANLLPVPYFHVVFTVPKSLHGLLSCNPRIGCDLFFKAAAETLQEVAFNPRNLGAKIGFLSILHTWTQKLLYHPHLHCIVPGGGLSPAGDRWIPAKPGFFLPVRVLSRVFRGKLLSLLERSILQGRIALPRPGLRGILREASRQDWVVYSKPPFSGPEAVLQYLSRYTHRIAISNQRLLSMTGDLVSFLWKDRSDGNRNKVLTLDAVEFLQRFLRHVLPRGFVRIRHYGFLANPIRKKMIKRCREFLHATPPENDHEPSQVWHELLLRINGKDALKCPICQMGRLELVDKILPSFAASLRLPGRGSSP